MSREVVIPICSLIATVDSTSFPDYGAQIPGRFEPDRRYRSAVDNFRKAFIDFQLGKQIQ